MKKIIYLLVIAILSTSCSKEILQHKLTVDAIPSNGGSVTPPSNSYENGQSVNLLATPAGEYVFKEWKGDLSGTLNPNTLIIDKDKQVTGVFEKRQYPLNLTIEGNGTVKEEIIAVASQSQYPSGTTVRLTPQPLEGWEFSGWSGEISNGQSQLDLVITKPITLKANFIKSVITGFEITGLTKQQSVTDKIKFGIIYSYQNQKSSKERFENLNYSKIAGSGEISFVDSLGFICSKSGTITLKFNVNNIVKTIDFEILPYKIEMIHPFLANPAKGSSLIIPVVIINYFPTKDGVNIDQTSYPIRDYADKIVENCKLSEINNWTLNNDVKTKFGIEEGSKFRGFNNSSINSYVGIKVLKIVTFYEVDKIVDPLSKDKEEGYYPNYKSIFDKIGLENLVNNFGVKEVWFNRKSLNVPESNMSSALTGDISNSFQIPNDLPIYNKSYIVYGNFTHRWFAENLHNRGHQIEAQLAYLEEKFGRATKNNFLFWNSFVGFKRDGSPYYNEGRVGSTHFTPNSIGDYDYDNENMILSDINDWTPDNTGSKTLVNNNTWKRKINLDLSLPQVTQIQRFKDLSGKAEIGGDPQSGWLIYWFQSIPGFGNQIKYNGKQLNNWWDLFYNWDDAIKNKKTLWVE